MATKRAYNLTVVPGSVATVINSNGTKSFKTRASLTLNGRQVERTLIVPGKMHAALKGQFRKGREIALRCLISKVANDDGTPGGEFLTAVALPRAKAAA